MDGCHFGNTSHINNINNMSVISPEMRGRVAEQRGVGGAGWRAVRVPRQTVDDVGGRHMPAALVPAQFVKPLVVDSEVVGYLMDHRHGHLLHHVLA